MNNKKLCDLIPGALNKVLSEQAECPDNKYLRDICSNVLSNKDIFSAKTRDYITTLKDLNLVTAEDVTKPRYIFDRTKEIANNTLGEAIISSRSFSFDTEYLGHWVDKDYLNTADFFQLLGTWLHEVCHKGGGDGSEEFTYILTDMLRVLMRSNVSSENSMKLNAIEKVFNNL